MTRSGRLAAGAALALALIAAVVVATSPRDGWDEARGTRATGTVLWAVGDGADGGDPARRLAESIVASGVHRFLYLGDVYEDGTAAEFAENYDRVYGALAHITEPTPGNHEWARRAEGYNPYWRRWKGETPPEYYAFRLQGWTILSLNSETAHGRHSAQVRWLRDAVRARGTCRLAFWHRPRHSAGRYRDEHDLEPLWAALRGRATIVVNGHDHNMQRFEPRDGITQFVSGAGGHGIYELDHRYPKLAYGNDRELGALRLELAPGVAHWKFISDRGQVRDAGTIRCRSS